MFRKLFYLVSFVVLLSISFPAKAEFVITNGDFEAGAGAGDTENVSLWYDDLSTNFWESAWELDRAGVTPNGSMVVVFCSWNTVEGDPLIGSYIYQSIGTSSGESSVTIGFDWGHPDDAAADRLDGLTVSVLASDGSFVASDGNDVLGAEGVTLLDSASYSHVSEGTDGEIFPVVVALDLSGANEGDEIFLRFNNYLPEAGADPWPILDNVKIIDMAIAFGTPVIDGEVDDIWADAATAEYAALEDPADGSGTWKALYDAENLYVLVDVTDDSLQNDSDGSWQDDSVEIYFDGGNTKLSTALSGDDHQYTFGWTTEEIQGTNIDGYTDGIEHAQVDTETGWRIEVKMPWMSIWGVVPQAGDLIGIDCYYNDDDDGGDSREGKMLGFSVVEGWNDASQWGTAALAAKVKPKPKIIWVSDGYDDNGDDAADDLEWVDILEAEGYSVDYQINALGDGYWRTLDDDKIAALNAADLIIVSRNSNSGDYNNDDEVAQWNAVTTPLILSSTHIVRSSRWKWVDSTTILSLTPEMVLADGTAIPGINAEVGPGSFIDSDPGNGEVLATGDGLPFIIKWEAGEEFYEGAGQIAGGTRVFFVAGTQEDTAAVPPIGRGEMNLMPEALAVYLSIVDELIPAKLSDITAPGDIVKGVPDDGDWPGAEYPALAIDNNVNTKFLHFKGETEPTGIKVTPLDGPSVVTGIALTTANDATERDPVTFELYGSNESIDGPYELIASGDIVDFAGETAWPRYTKNATPITFANETAYANYQILFPTVRDPGSANSMQIAEIELIGTLGEGAPGGLAYDGDSLEGWDHDNGSDAWDDSAIGEGNPGGASLLTEDGVTLLRIQDIGDPRDLGISDPSNRKIYLTHAADISLDALTIEVKMRVATTPPLDDQISGDPWPAEGIGYHIRDGGKGMIGVSDGVGIISFSLGQAGEADYPDAASDLLVMNNLVGTEPSGDVDTGEGELNAVAIDDASQWNTFVIEIAAGGTGTHVVTISANGGAAQSFDVTEGDGTEADVPYVAIGSSGTGGTTAFDVDYITVK
jgi:hypothetical protein